MHRRDALIKMLTYAVRLHLAVAAGLGGNFCHARFLSCDCRASLQPRWAQSLSPAFLSCGRVALHPVVVCRVRHAGLFPRSELMTPVPVRGRDCRVAPGE